MNILNLFRPKWKNSNPNIRLGALHEIDDFKVLVEIALNDIDSRVRQTATNLLNSQFVDLLIDLIIKQDFLGKDSYLDSQPYLRYYMKLVDSNKLFEIAIDNSQREGLRKGAAQQLFESNPEVALKIALDKTIDTEVRKFAAGTIGIGHGEQGVKIALNNEFDIDFRIEIIKGIVVPKYLVEIGVKCDEYVIYKNVFDILVAMTSPKSDSEMARRQRKLPSLKSLKLKDSKINESGFLEEFEPPESDFKKGLLLVLKAASKHLKNKKFNMSPAEKKHLEFLSEMKTMRDLDLYLKLKQRRKS